MQIHARDHHEIGNEHSIVNVESENDLECHTFKRELCNVEGYLSLN